MKSQLPTKSDFDPSDGDLDAQWAWDQFGGLDIDEAYKKFCGRPEIHQEDFMFMGPEAFIYYFPVIERYLKEVVIDDDYDDDYEVWIIGCALLSQLKLNTRNLKMRINNLSLLVLDKFMNSPINEEYKNQIQEKWQEIQNITKS